MATDQSGTSSDPKWIKNKTVVTEVLRSEVTLCKEKLLSGSVATQCEGAGQLYQLIVYIWSMEAGHLSRDAADLVCDEIRENGGLQVILQLCSSADKELQLAMMRALEQLMVSGNRRYITENKLFDSVVKVAGGREPLEMIQSGTGILENLFKVSAETCLRLIQSGALETIIYACRSSDPTTLQHCSAALANCAMYGNGKAQCTMVSKKADLWLFPLAFSNDRIVKYYALLAICFLAANDDLAEKVAQSGTLDLVLPFVRAHDVEEFAVSCPNHSHGRSLGWLKHLVPLLVSRSEEARSLAAFHFAMEAGIKKKQQRLHILTDIDAISHLQTAAKQGSHLTARLCCQALTISEAALPPYQCWNVLNWSENHVASWVSDIDPHSSLASFFVNHRVTGNMLVDLTTEDLLEIGIESKVKCKWFLERVRKLRCLADVSVLDSDGICKWLVETSKDLAVYRVDFVRKGVAPNLLPNLTDELLKEIGVHSSVDRLKIMVLGLGEIPKPLGHDTPDFHVRPLVPLSSSHRKKYDVFISYRRATGSQLASLLKVHLQLRGVSVFLDVAELGSGKFDDALLTTISHSSNILLIMSPGTLDRCVGDSRVQDWVHREIVCALDNAVHVIPVVDQQFSWPRESNLPEDIRAICKINGVTWSHEYQDASVEKIVNFLRLTPSTRRKSSKIHHKV